MKKNRSRYICFAALVAALYVVLTWLSAVLGLSSGAPQCRLSEALCVLPLFSSAAIPGLGVGCFLANVLFSPVPADWIFGTLATVLGAWGCRLIGQLMRSRHAGVVLLATLPNTVMNTLVIPFVLRYAYGLEQGIGLLMIEVGLGEVVSCCILGTVLGLALRSRLKMVTDL